eukprot:g22484.t1
MDQMDFVERPPLAGDTCRREDRTGGRRGVRGCVDVRREGFTAQAACCACGGGQVQSIAGLWQVLQGPCTVDTEGCLLSPNYPQNYSNNQRCTIIVNQTLAQPIRVVDWDVEYWFDFLLINGRLFSGTLQPLNQTPNGSMHWVSDEDTTGTGWKLCPGNGTSSEAVIGSTTSSSERSFLSWLHGPPIAGRPGRSTTPVASSTTTEVTESTSSSSSSSSSTPLPTSSPSAPSACKDVEGWMDAAEFSCNEYAQEQWCTVEKHPGSRSGFASVTLGAMSPRNMARPCGVVDTAGTHVPRGPMSAALVSGNNQRCTIAVNQSLARPFQVVDFDTERNYDRLTVNGRSYSGRKKPSGVVPFTAIGWESDEDLTARGWKICPGDFAQGPEMFSVVGGPCTVDSSEFAVLPRRNYPQTYGPNQDCAIQVFNPDNKSLTVESFATEMNYDVLWVNGRMFAGTTSPHGLVPTEAIQWSSDQDTEDRGWKICPGPVGQQDVGVSTGNFFFKVALASIAVCLAGVLCLRYRRQRKENRNLDHNI